MGINFNLTIDTEKLRRRLTITKAQIDELGNEILIALADRLVQLIKEKAPRDTGTYAENWAREEPAKGKIAVTNPDGKLFNILEFTGRRKIHVEPKKAKVLHFVIDGEDIFVMWSNPGATQPDPHVRPAMKQTMSESKKIIIAIIKKKFPMFK